MADFEAELRLATQRLREFTGETDRAARGTRQREQEAEQRSTLARLGSLLGAGLGGLTPAANAFGATGSFEDAADVASAGLTEALARAFPTTAGVLGVNKELNARVGARGETIGLLDDLARHNVPISDEFLQRVIDTKLEQHDRIETLRQRVTARTGYTLGEAADDVERTGLDKLTDVLGRLTDWLESSPLSGGGGQR